MSKNTPTLRLIDDPLAEEIRELRAFADDAAATNTQRAYGSDWRHFESWCAEKRIAPVPIGADELALYLKSCVEAFGLSVATTRRKLAAIADAHKRNGSPFEGNSWIVKNTMKRLQRENGRPARGKSPLLVKDLRKMVLRCSNDIQGVRDKAVLLLGFAGALRRSELVNLDVEDISGAEEGLILTIRRSKTDQTGKGLRKGIPFGEHAETCAVRAVLAWMDLAHLSSGPLFRGITKNKKVRQSRLSDQVVALIVKKYSGEIGKQTDCFSGHSLRAGFATSASIAGASEASIQRQTGHQSLAVLRRYIRESSLFRENAASKIPI